MDPSAYPRRILLAVTGLSPQVVTETLYALAVKRSPRYIPTRIKLITTVEGRERARLSLLHEKSGWFHRLCRSYDLPPIAFSEQDIHVLVSAGGQPMKDIRTPEDNRAAADFITDRVREITQDDGCALHVSIAGGRKTMGFYLGYALSLFGRQQDRLSHVLVSHPYESHPQFFYPTVESEIIYTLAPDNRPYDTRDAEVTLAEIPFVRLRDGLNDDLTRGRCGFSQAVAQAQTALPPRQLILDPHSRTLQAGGECITLRPSHFAFYWMLAERAKSAKPGIHWSETGIEKEFLGFYRRLVNPASGDYERAEQGYAHGMTKENFDPIKSHIKRCIQERLGMRRAKPYLIEPLEQIKGTRYRRYGLSLPPRSIVIGDGKLAGERESINNSIRYRSGQRRSPANEQVGGHDDNG